MLRAVSETKHVDSVAKQFEVEAKGHQVGALDYLRDQVLTKADELANVHQKQV